VVGAIFSLKNNWGWQDTTRIDHHVEIRAVLDSIDGKTRGLPCEQDIVDAAQM
jgi:hypothetical protein